MAAAKPAGPAPTMTTSYCIDSRSVTLDSLYGQRETANFILPLPDGLRRAPSGLAKNVLCAGNAAAHGRFDGRRIFARGVVTCKIEIAERRDLRRTLKPGRAGYRRAFFRDHPGPFWLWQ